MFHGENLYLWHLALEIFSLEIEVGFDHKEQDDQVLIQLSRWFYRYAAFFPYEGAFSQGSCLLGVNCQTGNLFHSHWPGQSHRNEQVFIHLLLFPPAPLYEVSIL